MATWLLSRFPRPGCSLATGGILLLITPLFPYLLWVWEVRRSIEALEVKAHTVWGKVYTPPGGFSISRKEVALRLVVKNPGFGDADLAGLVSMDAARHLVYVELDGTDVTDSSIESLSRLPRLYSLDVSNTNISAAGFGRLCRLPRLASLRAQNLEISSEALAQMKAVPLEKQRMFIDIRGATASLEAVQRYANAINAAGIRCGGLGSETVVRPPAPAPVEYPHRSPSH